MYNGCVMCGARGEKNSSACQSCPIGYDGKHRVISKVKDKNNNSTEQWIKNKSRGDNDLSHSCSTQRGIISDKRNSDQCERVRIWEQPKHNTTIHKRAANKEEYPKSILIDISDDDKKYQKQLHPLYRGTKTDCAVFRSNGDLDYTSAVAQTNEFLTKEKQTDDSTSNFIDETLYRMKNQLPISYPLITKNLTPEEPIRSVEIRGYYGSMNTDFSMFDTGFSYSSISSGSMSMSSMASMTSCSLTDGYVTTSDCRPN
jgi:hypothetical protein